MKYEFDKNLRKVTVVADNFDDVLDIEELKRVAGSQLDQDIVPHMLDMIEDGTAPIILPEDKA